MRGSDRGKYIAILLVFLVLIILFVFVGPKFTGFSVFEKRNVMPINLDFSTSGTYDLDLDESPTSIKLSGSHTGNIRIYVKERNSETKHLVYDSQLSTGDSPLLSTITGSAVDESLVYFVDSCKDSCKLSDFQKKITLVIEIYQGTLNINKLLYISNPLINNPPRLIEGVDVIKIHSGQTVAFDLNNIFVDAEDDELIYLVSDLEGIKVQIIGNELRITADDNIDDAQELNLKVTDLKNTIDAKLKLIVIEGSSSIDLDRLDVSIRDKYQRKFGVYELVPRIDGKLDVEISTLSSDEKKAKEIYEETPEIELAERLLSDEAEVIIKGIEEVVSDEISVSIDKSEDANINTNVVSVKGLETFESAEITLPKTGPVSRIFNCDLFDDDLFVCISGWEKTDISFTDNGDSITFEVTEFSAYAGGEIEIITIQAYPMVGGYWTVRFNTTGTADLTITPINGTTFAETPEDDLSTEDDLEFLSLRCGGLDVPYQELKNGSSLISIFVSDYNCSEDSTETSLVLTEGRHDIMFQFGDDIGFARNNATQLNVSANANVIFEGTTDSLFSGNSLTVADFNNDAFPDLAIGSADSSTAGRIDVFYGPIRSNSTFSINNANITFVGIAGGDLNNAFLTANASFFVIGAPQAKATVGQIFMFKSTGGGLSGTVNVSTANITINGTAPGGKFGNRLALIANGTALDLVASAVGNNSVHLIRNVTALEGKYTVDQVVNLTIYSATNETFGDEVISGFPNSTSSLAIAAPLADTDGLTDNGVIYIYFDPLSYNGNLTNLQANVTIYGNQTNLKIGEHLSASSGDRTLAAGKFRFYQNDLAVGVKNGGASSAGRVMVFYNISLDTNQTINISKANITILGNKSSDSMGGVAFGSLNNDYFADLIVASPKAGVSGTSQAGEAYVFYGELNPPAVLTVNLSNLTAIGNESLGLLGTSLLSMDLNIDNWEDLIIGVPGMQSGANSSAGKTFVFFSEANVTGCGAYTRTGGNFLSYGPFNQTGTNYLKNNIFTIGTENCIGSLLALNFKLDCQRFNITGNKTPDFAGTAITATTNQNNATIQNCNFMDFIGGITFGSDTTSHNITILNNTFNRTGIAQGAISWSDSVQRDIYVVNNTFENSTWGLMFTIGTTLNRGNISFNTFNRMGGLNQTDAVSGKSSAISSLLHTSGGVGNFSIFNNTIINNYVGIFMAAARFTNNSIYFNNFTNSNLSHMIDNNNVGTNNYTNLDSGLGRQRGNTYSGLTALAIFDTNGDNIGDFGANYPYNNSNGGNVTGGVQDTAPWPVPSYVNVSVVKNDTPDPVYVGSALNYNITLVANLSSGSSVNVTVNETYPSQLTFVSATPSASSGNNTWVIWLNQTGNYTINISLTVNSGVANGTVINNSVRINYTNTTSQNQNLTGSANTTILALGDINVSKSSDPTGFALNGTNLTYSISLVSSVSGPMNVSVNDTFPSHVTFLSSTPGPTISPNYWLVQINETGTFVINVSVFINSTAPNATVLRNNVSINYSDVGSQNVIKNATHIITVVTDVRYFNRTADNNTINKYDRLDPVISGENLTYVVLIHNNNSYTVDANITDRFDGNVTYLTATKAPMTGNHTWNLTISANTNQTVNITVGVASGLLNGTILTNVVNASFWSTNAVPITRIADEENTTVISNASELPRSVGGVGNVTKNDNPDPVYNGSQLSYSIIVFNTGSELRNFTIRETYPSQVVFNNSNPAPNSSNDTWILEFAPLANKTINITVNVSENVSNGTIIYNVVNVSFVNSSEVSSPTYRFSDTEDTTVVDSSNHFSQFGISIIKTDNPDPVESGAQLKYTITITNNNASSFNGTVVERYDPRVGFLTSQPVPNSSNNTWNLEFANNSIFQINLTVQLTSASSGDVLVNRVNLTFSEPFLQNNLTLSAKENTTVSGGTGGGGGGGGGGEPICKPEWVCTSWSPVGCPPSGVQSRSCAEINGCKFPGRPPASNQECMYEPEEELESEELSGFVIPDLITTWFWLLWFLVILMLIISGLCAIYLLEKKEEEENGDVVESDKIVDARKIKSRDDGNKLKNEPSEKIKKSVVLPDVEYKYDEERKTLWTLFAAKEKGHKDYARVLRDLNAELEGIETELKDVEHYKKLNGKVKK